VYLVGIEGNLDEPQHLQHNRLFLPAAAVVAVLVAALVPAVVATLVAALFPAVVATLVAALVPAVVATRELQNGPGIGTKILFFTGTGTGLSLRS
jgi:Na+(H+)/acetate symporter ActP